MRNTSLVFGLVIVIAGAWAAQAGADGPVVIFSEVAGDPTAQVPGLPPGTEFDSFDRIYQSPDGTIWILSASSNLSTSEDEVIIIGFGPTSAGSAVVVREGTPASWTGDVENIGFIDRNLGINDAGQYAFATNTNGPTSTDEYIIRWDGGSFGIVVQEGDAVPGFPGNAFGSTLNSPHILNGGTVGFRAPSTVGDLPSNDDDFLFLGSTLVAQENNTVPGNQAGGATEPWDSFDSQDFYHSTSDGSSHIIQGDLTGSTSSDDVVAVNGLVVVQEASLAAGMLSPVDNIREVSMTANGAWFVRGDNEDDQDWIIFNGSILSLTGDEVPGSGGTELYSDAVFSATYFAMTGNSLGDYVIGATTDNPDPEADAVLVFNGTEVIARQGDPVDLDGNGLFDDDTFLDTFNNDDAFLTNDLMYYFTATLQDAVGGASLGQAYMAIQVGGCADDADCNDEDACTSDVCNLETGECSNEPIVCDDENDCTADSCEAEQGCVNTPECMSDGDCDDQDACTTDTCSEDGCCEHAPVDCNDNNDCTADSCEAEQGCVNTPECMSNGDCDDQDACTIDTCSDDGCCEHAPVDCSDSGDQCNTASCDPDGADGNCDNLTPVPNGTSCGSDSDTDCDNPDTCSAGVCQDNYEDAGTGCTDDGNGCTDDVCNGSGGCTHPNNTDPCDDDNACTTEDTCSDGACEGGPPLDCDDNDGCTADSCDPATGCVHEDIEQTLIIKQGASGQGPDCEAPVNANSNGVLPILLVGTEDFNVHAVNQASLDLHLCGDGPSGVQPIESQTKFKDLNHPTDLPVGCPGCQCNDDESSDGIDDLSMKFSTNNVVATLGLAHGIYTLELTGTLNDGSPFCARDCIIVVPPGSGTMNATMGSNVLGTLLEVTPMDLNFDIDGFADFSRAYIEGTTIALTAPSTSDGRRFLRWSVDGAMQAFGIRTIEVTISEDTTLKAFYQRPGRVLPDLPTEGDGDME